MSLWMLCAGLGVLLGVASLALLFVRAVAEMGDKRERLHIPDGRPELPPSLRPKERGQ